MSASLQLDKYFFTRLIVEAHPPKNGESNTMQGGHASSKISLELHHPDGEKQHFQLTLAIIIEPLHQDEPIPYTAEIETVGFFAVPDLQKEQFDIDKLVKITGGAILYSAAREQILSITARGPFPPMQLPTINLVRAVEDNNLKTTDTDNN